MTYSRGQASTSSETSSHEWASVFLRRISVPRLPGSRASSVIRSAIFDRLKQAGYSVRVEDFSSSPRRLVAVSLLGAGLGLTGITLGAFLVFGPTHRFLWVASVSVALGVYAVGTSFVRGLYGSNARAIVASNVVAVRGEPKLWLIAHSDSKGQFLSLAGRVLALCVGAAGLLILLGCSLTLPLLFPPLWVVIVSATSTAVGGFALFLDPLRNDSPGAVDNASGVVAALVAADVLRNRSDIGILITDAEEYGMEGARDWVTRHQPTGLFMNFDGLDSRGQHRVVRHAAAKPLGDRGTTHDVAEAVASELRHLKPAVRIRGLPPGVFVDGAVLAAAGMAGVTISRGDITTLGVVHTARDCVARIEIDACIAIGMAAARAAEKLLS